MSEPVDASAPPVRVRGVRTRAGNAMGRTRAAVLDGAVRAIEKYGARRATMGDIATVSGVAKATLYNHFRTKEAVYAAVLEAGVRDLAAECTALAAEDLAGALAVAAERLSGHPALRRIAADEPALVAGLVGLGPAGAWPVAREGAAAALAAAGRAHGPEEVDAVLRWLVSHVAAPAEGAGAAAGARVLATGLPPAQEAEAPVVPGAEAPAGPGVPGAGAPAGPGDPGDPGETLAVVQPTP